MYIGYDYRYPSSDFLITSPRDNQSILVGSAVYGTKTYDDGCQFVLLYVKNPNNINKPFRLLDYNPIENVGTWSLQIRMKDDLYLTRATLFIGLSHNVPKEPLQQDLNEPPKHDFLKTIDVEISHQTPPLPPD